MQLIQNTQWQNALKGKFSLVRVKLTDGVYRLDNPLLLNNWGSGPTNNVKLEIAGSGVNTIISGAKSVTNWKLASNTDLPARVSGQARGKLWIADVAALKIPLDASLYSYGFFGSPASIDTKLFVGNQMQPIATWPNVGYGKLLRPSNLPASDKKSFSVEGRVVNDWAGEPNLQVFAYWFYDWSSHTYLTTTNIGAGVLALPNTGSPYGIKNGQRLQVKNALRELDVPGEWYLDKTTQKLYYWPSQAFSGSDAELSVAPQLFRISTSKNISMLDMTLEKVRGDAMTITSSEKILLDRLKIQFTGFRAVVINKSSNSGVSNSLIQDDGQGGVLLDGGDRQTLTAANNFVTNSVIRRFSLFSKTYTAAVQLTGVGQCVFGNKISEAPHLAIYYRGNDHAIENNEIFNVVQETNDAGAIYTGRDLASRGTVIANNYFHDIMSATIHNVKGIYLDDQAAGVMVRDNIFLRVQEPVFLGGGRDNVIQGNLFYKTPKPAAVHLDARGIEGAKAQTLDPKGPYQKSLDAVPYKGFVYAGRYPNLPKIRADNFGAPKYNVARNNLSLDGDLFSISPTALSGISLVNNFVGDGSVLTNQSPSLANDFQLLSTSAAATQGFTIPKVADFTVPYKCSGLYK
jgi:hypothetical protein